ncbi:hypothetical protein [Rothia mucilaginosa]|uniref:hypothetical protein n=1 Tax=Rothia mucilaginosa TaxID=43675 RepID=UPI003C781833
MTATTAKTKRDRAAGRHHRHTAIQTIVNNHQGIIDDIARIDSSIAALQDEVCENRRRTDHLYFRYDQHAKDVNANVGFAMQCIVENERKAAEVEAAVGILQHTSKEHQEAIAQLIVYTNKVHGKQVAFNQEINLLQAEVDDTNRRLFQLAWITVGLWAIAAITIFAYLITTH